MSRTEDLERSIRECYGLIREYEVIDQTTSDPKERLRCRRAIQEQWSLIRRYLSEYHHVVGEDLPVDVAEIESSLAAQSQVGTASLQRLERQGRSANLRRLIVWAGGGIALLTAIILVVQLTPLLPIRPSSGTTAPATEPKAVQLAPTQTPAPSPPPTTTPAPTDTATPTPTPTPIYPSGLITYVTKDGNGENLYALSPDGAAILLAENLTGVRILAVSPNRDYLAIDHVRDDLHDLLVVSADGALANTIVHRADTVGAMYTPNNQLLVAVYGSRSITYTLALPDGGNQRVMRISEYADLGSPTPEPTISFP